MKTIDQISTEITEQIMFNERHVNFVEMGKEIAKRAYLYCQKEYEEKLRWIPVNEKLPKNDKYVEVKDSTGDWDKAYWDNDKELWVFQNAFSNISHVVEWRSFL